MDEVDSEEQPSYVMANAMRSWRQANLGHVKELNRAWRLENPGKYRDIRRRRRAKNGAQYLIERARVRARNDGIEFRITKADVEEFIQPMTCAVTGVPLVWDWEDGKSNPWRPSLDRIDSSLGYVPGNIRVVCWAYNAAKQGWSDDVVLRWARSLISHS